MTCSMPSCCWFVEATICWKVWTFSSTRAVISSMEPHFSLRRVSRMPWLSSWNTPIAWPEARSS